MLHRSRRVGASPEYWLIMPRFIAWGTGMVKLMPVWNFRRLGSTVTIGDTATPLPSSLATSSGDTGWACVGWEGRDWTKTFPLICTPWIARFFVLTTNQRRCSQGTVAASLARGRGWRAIIWRFFTHTQVLKEVRNTSTVTSCNDSLRVFDERWGVSWSKCEPLNFRIPTSSLQQPPISSANNSRQKLQMRIFLADRVIIWCWR